MEVRKQRAYCLHLVVLLFSIPVSIHCRNEEFERHHDTAKRSTSGRTLLSQPSAFVSKAVYRLKRREDVSESSAKCSRHLATNYLEKIRRSRYTVCGLEPRHRSSASCANSQTPCESAVDCYTAPFMQANNTAKASVSLCRSHNLVLDSCNFLNNDRKGGQVRRFPLPLRGSVKLACPLADLSSVVKRQKELQWLDNIHHNVWWGRAAQDSSAVQQACASSSSSLVTTPTLFVMRERHANYAHEMEAASMVFAFLAALDPEDVGRHGLQVVIVDLAPPMAFLEMWARISRPYPLRILMNDPFPPNTCFRSAFHIYTFAGGIGYNTDPDGVSCVSSVVTGFSNWLRHLYGEADPWASRSTPTSALSAEVVAGPAAEEAGIRGLRPPAGGIVLRNVVWLSRRSSDIVRVLLNESTAGRFMRMVRNDVAVVAGIQAAVQEWNAESCLLQRFDKNVKAAYELSLTVVDGVHAVSVVTARRMDPNITSTLAAEEGSRRSLLLNRSTQLPQGRDVHEPQHVRHKQLDHGQRESFTDATEARLGRRRDLQGGGSSSFSGDDGDGSDSGEYGHNEYSEEAGDDEEGVDEDGRSSSGGGAGAGAGGQSPYKVGNNILLLDKLWDLDTANGNNCRRTNVLFRFEEADFDEELFHVHVRTMLRTGVLVGIQSAGLAHGYFMPPGQSAVLQLLGQSFARLSGGNVFRNMASGAGNYYEDVLYDNLDLDVTQLKAAVKRAMDFVATKTMEAQRRRSGALRLVLVDQKHFAIVAPSKKQCHGNGAAGSPLTQHDTSN